MTTKTKHHALDELKNWNTWVSYELKPGENGKTNKIPKDPATGKNAATDNPATWGSYDQAIKTGDGPGFVFTKVGGIVGIDLDGCINEAGDLEPWAENVVKALDSYTEKSPSGRGLHIFVKGEIPRSRKRPDIEIYDSGRFFTWTGKHWPGTPQSIEERPVQLLDVYHHFFDSKEPRPAPAPTRPVSLADSELINKAKNASNGAKFAALWNGDITGYPSQSEADQALCNHLAFWAGNDPARIDSLFRQSGLYREKWGEKHFSDGRTYGQATIDKAITATTEVYTPKVNQNGNEPAPETKTSPEISDTGDNPKGATWADLELVLGPIEWDWSGWLAKGFQTLVGSMPGEGKSNLLLRIAACYLMGWPWPDGQEFTGELGDVLWCETEAAQALNLERARAWNLPLDRVHTPLDNPLEDINLDNLDHQAAIIAKASDPAIKLIIIDSLSGGTRRDAGKSNQMLEVGHFLAELSRDAGKPVLTSHHLRKKSVFDGDVVNLDRFRDSSAIVQTARVVWAIDAPDIEFNEQKRVYVVKSNLGKFPEPLGFEVSDTGLSFGDAPEAPKTESQLDKAIDLLLTILDREPLPVSAIEKEATGAAISMNTIRRAQKKLGIKPKKAGDGWYWGLPQRDINVRTLN